MKLLCRLKRHDLRPVKTFYTTITDQKDGKTVHCGTRDSWTGSVCLRCGIRVIERNENVAQSAGATQKAYDWLNEVPAKNNVIKLVSNND